MSVSKGSKSSRRGSLYSPESVKLDQKSNRESDNRGNNSNPFTNALFNSHMNMRNFFIDQQRDDTAKTSRVEFSKAKTSRSFSKNSISKNTTLNMKSFASRNNTLSISGIKKKLNSENSNFYNSKSLKENQKNIPNLNYLKQNLDLDKLYNFELMQTRPPPMVEENFTNTYDNDVDISLVDAYERDDPKEKKRKNKF